MHAYTQIPAAPHIYTQIFSPSACSKLFTPRLGGKINRGEGIRRARGHGQDTRRWFVCQVAADCTAQRGCGLFLQSRFSVRKRRVKCAPARRKHGVMSVCCFQEGLQLVSSRRLRVGGESDQNWRQKHIQSMNKRRKQRRAGGRRRRRAHSLKLKFNGKIYLQPFYIISDIWKTIKWYLLHLKGDSNIFQTGCIYYCRPTHLYLVK